MSDTNHIKVRRTIGELNGPWAILLKLALLTIPIAVSMAVAWNSYLHSNISNLSLWKAAAVVQIKSLEDKISDLQVAGSVTLQNHLAESKASEVALLRRLESTDTILKDLASSYKELSRSIMEIQRVLAQFEQRLKDEPNRKPLTGGK